MMVEALIIVKDGGTTSFFALLRRSVCCLCLCNLCNLFLSNIFTVLYYRIKYLVDRIIEYTELEGTHQYHQVPAVPAQVTPINHTMSK